MQIVQALYSLLPRLYADPNGLFSGLLYYTGISTVVVECQIFQTRAPSSPQSWLR